MFKIGNTYGFTKGVPPWNKGKKTGRNIKSSKTKTGNPILANRGEKHWNWKGGISRGRRGDRKHLIWCRLVKERDGWACRIKNRECIGGVIAHHILRYSDYRKLRYNINNGITLCRHHHPIKKEDEERLIPFFQSMVEAR